MIELETLGLRDSESVSKTFVDIEALELQDPVDKDEDPLVNTDWLCKNFKDDIPRLIECKSLEQTLAEGDTLKPTDWDWVSDLLLGNHAI